MPARCRKVTVGCLWDYHVVYDTDAPGFTRYNCIVRGVQAVAEFALEMLKLNRYIVLDW